MNNAMRLFLVCVLVLWTIAYFTSAIRKAGFWGGLFFLLIFLLTYMYQKRRS
jgi:hypothetical protein